MERGLTVSTLDYYVQRERRREREKLVRVEVVDDPRVNGSGFTVVLGNGRRVEMAGDFDYAGLARLLAVLERS